MELIAARIFRAGRRIAAVTITFMFLAVMRVEGANPFTVIALPDTQYYTKTDARTETYFKGQTNWIVNNRASENIAFMLHLGDIQNDGNPYYARTDNIYEPDFTRPTGLVPDDAQFQRADAALKILDDAQVPYGVVPGNHDYIDNTIKDEPIYYLKYFGPQRFASKPSFGGSSPASPTFKWAGMNTYHLFDAGGYKFLNLALQYAPDTNDLTWAQSIINANPGLPTILTTHAMLNTTGYQSGRKNIFDQLVKNNPQVIMTLNGHITGAYRQTETNIAGQAVQEMLVDYQFTQFPGYVDGAAYLRKMQFDTDANVVHVKSYSPVLNSYLTDSDNQFDLPLNLRQRFGLPVGQAGTLRQVSFRDGANGYAGTQDTYVDAGATTTTYGTQTGVWVDGDASSASGNQPRHGLLRFDNVVGASAIPQGATLVFATLTLRTGTGSLAASGDSMHVYRMLKTWSESSTWSSMSSGIAPDGTEAILADNATFIPTEIGGMISFDVTESIFAWISGAPNYGWALTPDGTNGWQFFSSEAGLLSDRPMLSVTYTIPEPLFTPAFVVMSAMFMRRPRSTLRRLPIQP